MPRQNEFPEIQKEFQVSSLNLDPGHTVTLWLNTGEGRDVQVEVRILHDGTPEIFTPPGKEVKTQTFEQWYAMPEED